MPADPRAQRRLANLSPALDPPKPATPTRKVQRHSPHRLLRHKLVLPGGVIVSAEKHKGRLVVRVESPGSGK